MARKKNEPLFDDAAPKGMPDFEPDPVAACIGGPGAGLGTCRKAKAGYYLSEELLSRLEETWLRLRLAREPVQSKSRLVELALELMLEDLEAGEDSRVLKRIRA